MAFVLFLVFCKWRKTTLFESPWCTSFHKGDLHMPKRAVRDSVSWLRQRFESAVFFVILTKFLHSDDHRNKICEFCLKMNLHIEITNWADVKTRVPFTYNEIKPSNLFYHDFELFLKLNPRDEMMRRTTETWLAVFSGQIQWLFNFHTPQSKVQICCGHWNH